MSRRYLDLRFSPVKLVPVGALEPHRLEIMAMREPDGDRCDFLIGTHGQLTTHHADGPVDHRWHRRRQKDRRHGGDHDARARDELNDNRIAPDLVGQA